MDKVFIVEGHIDYNSSTIISVHLDEDSANEKAEYTKVNSRYDWVGVTEHSITY